MDMASPILTLESKGKPHIIKVNLDSNTAKDLHLYAVYTNGDEDSAAFSLPHHSSQVSFED